MCKLLLGRYDKEGRLVLQVQCGTLPPGALSLRRSLNDGLLRQPEGHELPGKWRVAKEMVGRRLSQEEVKRLLAKFE